jgi:hypothetical protein
MFTFICLPLEHAEMSFPTQVRTLQGPIIPSIALRQIFGAKDTELFAVKRATADFGCCQVTAWGRFICIVSCVEQVAMYYRCLLGLRTVQRWTAGTDGWGLTHTVILRRPTPYNFGAGNCNFWVWFPNEVIGFNLHTPSGGGRSLGLTQPMRDISTRGDKARSVPKVEKFKGFCGQTEWEMWHLRRLTTLSASTTCYGDSFAFILQYSRN